MEMNVESFPEEEQQSSQLSLPFDFKILCFQLHMSSKQSKGVPNEVIIRENRENKHHSLLIAAEDATIPASTAFPESMIGDILPFLLLHDLFIFIIMINVCQKV